MLTLTSAGVVAVLTSAPAAFDCQLRPLAYYSELRLLRTIFLRRVTMRTSMACPFASRTVISGGALPRS